MAVVRLTSRDQLGRWSMTKVLSAGVAAALAQQQRPVIGRVLTGYHRVHSDVWLARCDSCPVTLPAAERPELCGSMLNDVDKLLLSVRAERG